MEALNLEARAALNWKWRDWWARPNQLGPVGGDWSTWLILAGRGYGKTRSGAEWIREQWKSGASRIALVAETAADARDVLVEGQSGLLAISPKAERPLYEPSKRRLTWPNGAVATLYNGTEPDQLRGPEHDPGWVDELAKYSYPQDTWDNLQFGLRLGNRPRVCVTTTPRPIDIIRSIVADPATVVTRGSTFDNQSNLPRTFLDTINKRYGGTRLGRQELYAEVLEDIVGALWTRVMIRVGTPPASLVRVVVAVDPSGANGSEDGDSIGIVVCAVDDNGHFWVLEDATCDLGPSGWGRRVVEMYSKWKADIIVAEGNFGGAMVESVIKTADRNAKVKMVHASRGKVVRAEPIAALYEQGRVSHKQTELGGAVRLSAMDLLEDQMMQMTLSGFVGKGSPDRVDAAVWGLTELALGSSNSADIEELIL